MGIIDRLSDVIRSYISEDSFGHEKKKRAYGVDSDLEAAYEELNEFLGRGERRGASSNFGAQSAGGNAHTAAAPNAAPEALRPAFAELGVPFGADPEACKTAYKKLLKVHHPDRHAGHVENMRKATEKSARINAAYEKIERWRATGTV